MRFLSTRGQTEPRTFREAMALGLAPDGGLFLPESLPDLSPRLAGWGRLSYAELAVEFLREFTGDLPEEDLGAMVHRAYARFTHPAIAPLRRLGERTWVLELFHGPTLAFKDFGLQLLGELYGHQVRATGRAINILGATSGDTGAAAIHGVLGRPRTACFILYPDGRVSPLQERQMACTGAAEVHALAVNGSFDDAQRVLKEVFADREFAGRHGLSAVNSINLARILAQSIYYLYAWLQLPDEVRAEAEFVVPTGNFGNVLAGWLLQRMEVPLAGFRVATNRNDILHRLFTTGEYRRDAVHASLAPSMDIQVASNFERFVYYLLDEDPGRVRAVMEAIRTTGVHRFEGFDRGTFTSSAATDEEITELIRHVHYRHDYLVDPHTACAFKNLDPARPAVVLATAHPAKFPAAMHAAIGREPTHPVLEALKERPVVRERLPAEAGVVKAYLARHAVT